MLRRYVVRPPLAERLLKTLTGKITGFINREVRVFALSLRWHFGARSSHAELQL